MESKLRIIAANKFKSHSNMIVPFNWNYLHRLDLQEIVKVLLNNAVTVKVSHENSITQTIFTFDIVPREAISCKGYFECLCPERFSMIALSFYSTNIL